MKNKIAKPKRPSPKRVLRLPDLDYAKTAVLNTLSSSDSRRSYRFAIDDFVTWYCSEPRLAFSKTVVLRYRLELEGRHLAPSTINLRLAAVRRLAYEAADTGLLSPELAAGIGFSPFFYDPTKPCDSLRTEILRLLLHSQGLHHIDAGGASRGDE